MEINELPFDASPVGDASRIRSLWVSRALGMSPDQMIHMSLQLTCRLIEWSENHLLSQIDLNLSCLLHGRFWSPVCRSKRKLMVTDEPLEEDNSIFQILPSNSPVCLQSLPLVYREP